MNCRRLVASCAALTLAPAAHAQLKGHTLTADWLFPDFNTSIETHEVIVGPGIELDQDDIQRDDDISIHIASSTVTFRFHNHDSYWTDKDFNGWRFADTNGTLPDFYSYHVLSHSPGVGNIDAIVTGHSADAFWADFGGVTVGDGDYITLKVRFIPSPATAAPLVLAALIRRRRSRPAERRPACGPGRSPG
jgi:hypothetical protein